MVSTFRAKHDPVGHLLEGRGATATSEVLEAMRERLCLSVEDVDVIEGEDLAGFAAPLDPCLHVAVHDGSLGTDEIRMRSRKVGGNSTGVLRNGRAWSKPRRRALCVVGSLDVNFVDSPCQVHDRRAEHIFQHSQGLFYRIELTNMLTANWRN